MKTENNPQLELFNDIKGTLQPVPQKRPSFFSYMRGYEKKILTIIAFMVVAISAFSLGVEKGKNTTHDLPLAALKTQGALPVLKDNISKPAQVNNLVQRYAIQVASYKTARYALEEAKAFKAKGLTSMIITKGSYSVLYVGNFSDQETAKSTLAELKKQKRYAGSTIRRL
jgi:hypothetical protein